MNNSKLNNDMYSGNNLEFYNKIRDKKINIVDKKMFKFIHIEGGHVPFVYDINLNTIENGTYEQNLDASITVLETYINRLKENNVYDNSVIVVMADHGYGTSVYDRYNPILYIKGLNKKHNFEVSDKKISFVDLIVAFNQLIDGNKTDTIFIGLNNKERRYLLYDYTNPSVLIEEIQKGKAWNSETIVESGKKFISG
jgi:phosphoglycerol transferase MdoB-like AlkP superfamily enzyme